MVNKQLQNQYPNIATWIEDGTIEIGSEYEEGIVVRAIDDGGVIFERRKLKDFQHAVNTLEKGIDNWCKENY